MAITPAPDGPPSFPAWLRATGTETGRLIAARDWSTTPLGPVAAWPQSLRTALGLLLRSPVPIVMLWGEAGIMLYNDAYAAFAGGRHPGQLGLPVREGWPEVADFNDHVMRVGLAGGTLTFRDQELTLSRHGLPERVWMDLDYSPVPGEDGRPAGVIAVVVETTDRVAAERRRDAAEAALREVEERYRLAARATTDAIWDWDLATGHVLWNEALEAAYGHPPADAEPTGAWWIAHIHPDDRERVDASIHALIDGAGEAWAEEYRFRRADGTYAFVLDRGHVIRDRSGRARRMIGAMLDLSARKAAEAELMRAGALLGAVMEAVPGVVYAKDREGRMLAANRGTALLVGRPLAEIVGRTDLEFLEDEAQAEAVMANDRRIMEAGAPEVLEEAVSGPGGEPLVWLSTKAPLRDAEGRVIGLVGSSLDITARKRDEERLRALNDTLAQEVARAAAERDQVWRNSRDLLVVVDAGGVFRAVNPAWTAILGHAPAEVVGRSFLDFVMPEDAGITRGAVDRTVAAEPLSNFENRYRHKDGGIRWISWHTSSDGGLAYGYGRDVTAEKERQAELEAAQEQLRQSQKMEAVGQLTGGLAHDFNNLLTGIAGSLELLSARVAQGRLADVERYVAAAQGAAKRAAALTHRLLAFSRRQTLDPRPTDANRLVAGMEELIRRTVGPEVAVEVVAAGGLWATLVDPNQLENAVLNLAINARDAMPAGGRLTIETANRWLDARAARARDLEPGQYVTLCVSDTGTGMTPEVAARAFDPFFTTKPIGMGTGLGLSMIYGFARQSGGQARIYSEPGQGAMLCLYLPRHHGAADAPEPEEAPAPAPRAGAGATVLVVDDEPTVRMLVAEVVEEMGHAAIEAADGAAGLRAIERAAESGARIDLLITDVGLPGGMNGRQVADAARALRPGLVVLFVTGYAENAVIGNGHLDPGMHVMTKPFSMEALAARIRELVPPGGGG